MNDRLSPNVISSSKARPSLPWLSGALLLLGTAFPLLAQNIAVTTRHAPGVSGNGRVEGSVQQLLGENIMLSGGATLTQDLLVPGTPTVQTSGNVSWQGVQAGAGSASPTGYTVKFSGNVALRYVRTRTNPPTIPSVPAPPAPTGTRSVHLSQAGQSAGDWTTLRDLTVSGNAGLVVVPAGTYRNVTASGSGGLTLGVAGATQPAVYSLQSLTLTGQTKLNLIGPVILHLASGITMSGQSGVAGHPEWLQIKVSTGGVTLSGGSTLYGEA